MIETLQNLRKRRYILVSIKELTTLEEMKQVQMLEEKVWQMPPIPTHQTVTAVKHGGIMVGAYDGEKLVGFSYGFAAFKNGKSYLCSHMLGVDEAYRSQQIGERLKQAQRHFALAKGYDLMVWTYDPLETLNGYLNLTKLGGICDTYIENCYGEMQDGLNKGLPSDRFEVHWHLQAPYVEHNVQPAIKQPMYLGTFVQGEEGLCTLQPKPLQSLTGDTYALPVPLNFQRLKTRSPKYAMYWRLVVREVCTALFAAGYAAVRLQQRENWNEYIFVKKQTLALGGKPS